MSLRYVASLSMDIGQQECADGSRQIACVEQSQARDGVSRSKGTPERNRVA